MRFKVLAAATAAGLTLGAVLTATPANAAETVNGSGSSFANKFITACAAGFRASTGNSVNYNSTGSGTGRSQFADRVVDFAATDGLYKSAAEAKGRAYTYVPIVGGPVAFLYNVPGVRGQLRVTSDVVSSILAGKITRWNDARIKSVNPGAALPSAPIRVVYRSTNSGTSENLTAYMNANSPRIWTRPKNGVIAVGNPAGRMPGGSLGVPTSQAMVTAIKGQRYSFGYADLSDTVDAAGKPRVAVAALRNAAGQFISPTSTAAANFLSSFGNVAADGSVSIDFRKRVSSGYQLSIFTYMLGATNESTSKQAAVRSFAQYLLGTCGPRNASRLGYAPIRGSLLSASNRLAAKIG